MKVYNPENMWKVPPQFSDIYAHGVEINVGGARQLHSSGQSGVTPEGGLARTFEAQCAQAMTNVETLLANAGMTMSDVYRLSFHVVSPANLPTLLAMRVKRWAGHKPATTTQIVAGLVRQEFLVQIDFSAQRAEG